ncbi:MAG: DNA helicase RecQ [Oscillospiraceae bacterium]|nr:DNA helicase RecQ [Oscillospiraceae bacterium]
MDKYSVLQQYFGYDSFRPGQEALIDGILQGRDVFGIMPTGGGKSICYQVPAALLPGITLVVSPLISLMQDQVLALKAVGIPAAYINSSLSLKQLSLVYERLAGGAYKLVYVAPERLDTERFLHILSGLQVSLLAVDEAHCISQWGQDFRPSYLRILRFLEQLPQRPVVAAFTATATQKVRQDVEENLGLRQPLRVVTGYDRPNLYFGVLRPKNKDQELLQLLKKEKNRSGIVYCATRKAVESVCQLLTEEGYDATRYHAGLSEQERGENQEDFLHDRKTVMVATNAFGMGIDKSNVSFVIHYNMPKSIEAYYQEAGRAGRDGTDARCILLFSPSDVMTARFLIEHPSENEELDAEQREAVRKQDLQRLDAMVSYCRSLTCLRSRILRYFGQEDSEGCGNCSSCQADYVPTNITKQAQMLLSCVKRVRDKLGYYVGITLICDVLRGSRSKRISELSLEELSTYGLMKGLRAQTIRDIARHLEEEGYLHTDPVHGGLRLCEAAAEILYRGKEVSMLLPPLEETKEPRTGKEKRKAAVAALSAREQEIFEALRALRMELARKAGVPAYTVFSDATLQDMVRKLPKNMSQFKKVSGVGELKSLWYGKTFLARLKEFV